MIEITAEHAERVNAVLGGIKNAPNKVFYNVINRALSTVRTQSGKLIAATYQIKQKEIKSNSNMRVSKANTNNLTGEIAFAGTVIPLMAFQVSPKSPQKKTVSVKVLRESGGKRLESAYVADLGRYGVGVFERLTSKRASSQQLFGPSVAHMAENERVLDQMEERAQETIDKRVEHEISRILNGYGG